MTHSVKYTFLVALLVVFLAACGRKGALEPRPLEPGSQTPITGKVMPA